MASFRELPPFANILLAIGLAAAIVGAGWYMPGLPIEAQKAELQGLNDEIAKLEPEVRNLEQIQRQAADLKAQVAGLQKQLEVLQAIVPEEKDVDEFIRLVHASAASSNVDIRRITAQPVVNKEFHSELPFELEFDGPYYSVMSFFAKLGQVSRIINVSDLTFNNRDRATLKYPARPGTTVIATCRATTFFTKSDAPPAVPGKAGAAKAPAKR